MKSKTISIHVSSEAARVYESAPANQQRKLDALISLKLTEGNRTRRSLEEIISEISGKAQERGMTPDILNSILNE